jgi:hypothetical protein
MKFLGEMSWRLKGHNINGHVIIYRAGQAVLSAERRTHLQDIVVQCK